MIDTTGIIVLGMHRSGTSALTRVLNLLGAAVSDNLLPPAGDNPRGFWEPQRIMHLHEAVFRHFGRSWKNPLPLPDGWEDNPKVQHALEWAIEKEKFFREPLWVMKDPRLCILLPMWKRHIPDMRCVRIYRPIEEVLASLDAREPNSTTNWNTLYQDYNRHLRQNSQNLPCVGLDFNELLTEWRSFAEIIAEDLGIEWPVSIEDAAPQIEAFLDPSLRHHGRKDD